MPSGPSIVTENFASGSALCPGFGFGGSLMEKLTSGGSVIGAFPICDCCAEDIENALTGGVSKAGSRKLGIVADGGVLSAVLKTRVLVVENITTGCGAGRHIKLSLTFDI